jgi:hypothetical protein
MKKSTWLWIVGGGVLLYLIYKNSQGGSVTGSGLVSVNGVATGQGAAMSQATLNGMTMQQQVLDDQTFNGSN